ncbi:MAG: AI-2E family transporter [Candidatus Margulisbacteria bacterium]|nr:AI-2E family transporter [Candidatus Margulisiibacteriota bacterium]MBU1022349.1 AI-2E family transporter [Candidatus Margulisiibacteriota bacterium]MBU1729099.1 AI-2E family transporter [Candidatus Margulisiibacteriota bacterium]MBU1954480.1 AI-2E family transporter [Candidatus Margulisiibacteriota bacterium]
MKVDYKQITRVIGLIIFLAFLYLIQDALFPIIIALILFYVLNPAVKLLSDQRPKGLGLNRTLSIILSALILIIILVTLISFIAPPFASEFNRLAENLPQFIASTQSTLDSITKWYRGAHLPDQVNAVIVNSMQNILNVMVNFVNQSAATLAGFLSQFIYLIVIPIITFYLLKDKESILKGIIALLPKDHQKKTQTIILDINSLLHRYFRGVFLLCILIGTLCGFGLYLLGVKYFLILGLIAAITEFIPVMGPFIGAVPAVIIAFISSPLLAAKVIVLYIVVQSVENTILVPRIMGERLNLHPITVILAMLILSHLIGVWGLFFAAPIAGIIKILYTELRKP